MGLLLTAFAASIFALTPMQTAASAPASDDSSAGVVALANARGRWNRVLDANDWDRDATAVRIAANEITLELLPMTTQPGALRAEALRLVGMLGADALGPYVQSQATVDFDLARAYLMRHDDAAVLALVAGDARTSATGAAANLDLAMDLARAHRSTGAAMLVTAIPTARTNDRERICLAAFGLPPSARNSVTAALVATWGAEPPEEFDVPCATLGATTRSGRATLARWMGRLDAFNLSRVGVGATRWIVAAALGLGDSEQHAAAERLRAVILGSTSWLLEVSQAISSIAALLPLRGPFTRGMLTRIASISPLSLIALAAARMRAHDPTLVVQSLELLRNPHEDSAMLTTAIGVVGLSATAAQARPVLVSLREQTRAFHTVGVSPRAIDRWVLAVDQVEACHHQHACLIEQLTRGSDAAAARAAVVLGPAALSSLRPDESHPLIRRLVVRPNVWLLGAILLSIEGCPAPLRGIREALSNQPGDDFQHGLQPFLYALDATCSASP